MRESLVGNEPNPDEAPLSRSPSLAPPRRPDLPFLLHPAPGGCLFLVLGALVGLALGTILSPILFTPSSPDDLECGNPLIGVMGAGGFLGFFAAAILSFGVALLRGLRSRQEIPNKASRDGWDEFAGNDH
jgi:hypothetical protein